MSSAQEKVSDYYSRGERSLSLQEITDVVRNHPWIPAPHDILMLDGDVVTNRGTAVGLNPSGESLIMLTPVSNGETVLHEDLHQGLGVGELGARVFSKILSRKNFALFPRNVHYEVCSRCQEHPDLIQKQLASYGLTPGFPGYPDIKHYILVED
jgi:hypothetical protein